MGVVQSFTLSSKFIVFQSYMTLKVLGSAVVRRQAPEKRAYRGDTAYRQIRPAGVDKFIYLIGIISVALGLSIYCLSRWLTRPHYDGHY